MARPRSFDTGAVLDKAVAAFSAKGYEATSLQDLEKATGLGRASLYGAFRDKHSLYLSALRHYDVTRASALIARLDAAPSGRKALETLFVMVVDECAASAGGCLIANATMERGDSDLAAARIIADHRRRMEGAIHAALLRGGADGSLKGRREPRAAARFLFATVQGLRALSKAACTRAQLREVSDLALMTAGG